MLLPDYIPQAFRNHARKQTAVTRFSFLPFRGTPSLLQRTEKTLVGSFFTSFALESDVLSPAAAMFVYILCSNLVSARGS